MALLFSLLVIVALSLLIVRIGAVALTMTGLSRDVANFQSQSAFSGVGFTTAESEYIVSHPVRRRIVRILMLLGTAGITSAVATLVLTFVPTASKGSGKDLLVRFGLVTAGLLVLFLVGRSRLLDRMMTQIIQRALAAATALQISDYAELLQLARGYAVAQVLVQQSDWLADKTLRELNLTAEGIVVLNMTRRGGVVLGTPMSDTAIRVGDRLLCYGYAGELEALSVRPAGQKGDEEHAHAVQRHATRRHVESVEDRIKPQEEGQQRPS